MISSDSTNKQLNRIKVKEDRVKMVVYCSLHHENPDGSAFCDESAEPLTAAPPEPAAAAISQPAPAPTATRTQTRSACRAENTSRERFCSNCAATLLGRPAAPSSPGAPP